MRTVNRAIAAAQMNVCNKRSREHSSGPDLMRSATHNLGLQVAVALILHVGGYHREHEVV